MERIERARAEARDASFRALIAQADAQRAAKLEALGRRLNRGWEEILGSFSEQRQAAGVDFDKFLETVGNQWGAAAAAPAESAAPIIDFVVQKKDPTRTDGDRARDDVEPVATARAHVIIDVGPQDVTVAPTEATAP